MQKKKGGGGDVGFLHIGVWSEGSTCGEKQSRKANARSRRGREKRKPTEPANGSFVGGRCQDFHCRKDLGKSSDEEKRRKQVEAKFSPPGRQSKLPYDRILGGGPPLISEWANNSTKGCK